jgi:dienelactone hydrolase
MTAPQNPRRRRPWWHYLLGGLALLGGSLFACCLCCGGFSTWWFRPEEGSSPVGLLEARAANPSRLVRGAFDADGPAPEPPPDIYNRVRYRSPAGKLVAYVTPDPGDGKKHPAVLWAHGGFGGIGEAEWEDDREAAPFRKAGLIVMCPSWRAENDNPGQYEMFYGEVDDALAAIRYLAQLSYVDPSRIYMVGHSTGGTLTLLTAEATTQLRAAFSLGGMADMWAVFQIGALPYPETPFNWHDQKERRLRSAIDYVEHLRTPTWYFEGNDAPSFVRQGPERMEQRARAAGVPYTAYFVDGGDHFNIVQPIGKLIAKKIQVDTGAKCNISITKQEVAKAFASR